MKPLYTLAVTALSSSIAFASRFEITGEVDIKVQPNNKTLSASSKPLEFKLPKIKLSGQSKKYLVNQLKNYPRDTLQIHPLSSELPPKMDLGMEGTPVLNQGMHGSCVTFAVTGAINALLGAGDYVSQLCSLELGSWLTIHNEQDYSGWKGIWAPIVLNQLMTYGIISQNYQKLHGCAGVHEYPLKDETDEGNPMSKAEYSQHSIPLAKMLQWSSILDTEDAFSGKISPKELIWLTKKQIAKGHRPVFAMLLDIKVGYAGAVGNYKVANDTWMLTPQIVLDAMHDDIYAGHEMVITGYDDEALVTDEEGHVNKGIFKLRNSWSSQSGDQGNYYVSYDYFAFFIMENHIIKLKG